MTGKPELIGPRWTGVYLINFPAVVGVQRGGRRKMARSRKNISSRNLGQLRISADRMECPRQRYDRFISARIRTDGRIEENRRVREEASQDLDSSGGWRSGRRSEAYRLAGAKRG